MLLSFVGRLDFLSCDKMQSNEVCVPVSSSRDLCPSLWIHAHLCSLVSTQHLCPKIIFPPSNKHLNIWSEPFCVLDSCLLFFQPQASYLPWLANSHATRPRQGGNGVVGTMTTW